MSICARYVSIQVVKHFESPKALYKFPVIIINIMFIMIIMLSVLLIFYGVCVCKVCLGLTLGVSALSILSYIPYPITRTTCKRDMLIVPQNVQKATCKARSSRTRA